MTTPFKIKMVSILSDKDLYRNVRTLKRKPFRRTKTKNYSDTDLMRKTISQASLSFEAYQRVYMYLQLQEITNLPQDENKKYYLSIRHNKTNFNDTREIDDTKLFNSFAIPIEQYNMDIANSFSDEPLAIILKEILVQANADAIEKTIAQGQIDLIHFFTNKRSICNAEVLLYPSSTEYINLEMGTCKTLWHVYSLLPIMKDEDFNNMIFITTESIYNASSDIMNLSDDLAVSISFRSKIPNAYNELETYPICTFDSMKRSIICEQDVKYNWASITKNGKRNLGQMTDCCMSIHKLFDDLLCTENVDFGLESISVSKDEALICNLLRRYVLNEKLTKILEDVIAFNEQELIIEVYQRSDPHIILLRGIIDLSIFLYPYVNSCRFAVQLVPVENPISSVAENVINAYHETGKVTFAIVNICILQPITESQLSRKSFKERIPEELKTCIPEKLPTDTVFVKDKADICEENYKDFDKQITTLVEYIIRKEIQTIDDSKGFLCCQRKNLIQNIMKLISCDFNVRVPTKNTIEFANLMTFVYKELEQRCYEITQRYKGSESVLLDEAQVDKLNSFMSIIKVLTEVGEDDLANIYKEKLKKLETVEYHVQGYTFLFNMEKQNFEAAREYMKKPWDKKFEFGDYYDGLFEIYLNYVEKLKAETVYNEAFQCLLQALEDYSKRFPKEPSIWILLYCLYNKYEYLPGMSFTRLKFENITKDLVFELKIPLTLWNIYCKQNLEFTSQRSIQFYKAIQEFLKLGLFLFAQIIFAEVLDECTETEKYCVETTLKILLKEPTDIYPKRSSQGLHTKIFQSHINGQLHYYNGEISAAKECYAFILENVQHVEDMRDFQLSFMRYGKHLFENGKYAEAINAYEQCTCVRTCKFAANFGLGRALYHLGRYQEAENQFSQCTNYGLHVPDVWGYLALVNLKMNKTFRALESWKYAKLYPDNILCDEIYAELRKIDIKNMTLDITEADEDFSND
uniref:Tetratricopeptide repeat protein 18 n=1 Tax=Ceratitis capitata TaxID=7213 RepID=W8AZH6_CERCA